MVIVNVIVVGEIITIVVAKQIIVEKKEIIVEIAVVDKKVMTTIVYANANLKTTVAFVLDFVVKFKVVSLLTTIHILNTFK